MEAGQLLKVGHVAYKGFLVVPVCGSCMSPESVPCGTQNQSSVHFVTAIIKCLSFKDFGVVFRS